MRKITTAFGIAAVLSVVMIGKPVLATDSGMSSNNDFVCAFAQGIVLKVPAEGRGPVKAALEMVTGCALSE